MAKKTTKKLTKTAAKKLLDEAETTEQLQAVAEKIKAAGGHGLEGLIANKHGRLVDEALGL